MRGSCLRFSWLAVPLAALLCATWLAPNARALPAGNPADQFQYNVLESFYDGESGKAVVHFSVTNPQAGNAHWDILHDLPFRLPGSRLFLQFGWNTKDYTNTGALDPALGPRPFGTGIGAALPMAVNALTDSVPVGDGTFLAMTRKPLPFQAIGTGVAAMEGHPVVSSGGVNVNVPVRSAYQYFGITDGTAVPRREVVDINKCKVCHTGLLGRDGSVIPRLVLHGSNRTEELRVCVVCHNPNQTDIPYRTDGAEESVDFKRMIHGIHAGKMRKNPLVIIGRNGSINDFSDVRFPASLKNCTLCHIDTPRGGTFELPLKAGVLGSTVDTGSEPGAIVDIDPTNDLKITPIASVCSACHDEREVISHMINKGRARFGVPASQITSGAVRERCLDCHGPGRKKDVRRVHSIDQYGED